MTEKAQAILEKIATLTLGPGQKAPLKTLQRAAVAAKQRLGYAAKAKLTIKDLRTNPYPEVLKLTMKNPEVITDAIKHIVKVKK